MSYYRWTDDRFGDIYEIYTDPSGDFEMARRSIDRLGAEAVYYDSLDDLPQPARNTIEHILWPNKK